MNTWGIRVPSVSVVDKTTDMAKNELRLLETIGRLSHRSGESRSPVSAEKFIAMIVRLGHESVLEHVSLTAKVCCDRATAMQWMRHRIASYTMESQRYVDYQRHGLYFIEPKFTASPRQDSLHEEWLDSICNAVESYNNLRKGGVPPEVARCTLPNCTVTEFYATMNLRSWRHFFQVRCAPGAQFSIHKLAQDLLDQLKVLYPVVFDDIKY